MDFLERKAAEYEAKLADVERKKMANWHEIKTYMPMIAQVLEQSVKFFGKSTLLKYEINEIKS